MTDPTLSDEQIAELERLLSTLNAPPASVRNLKPHAEALLKMWDALPVLLSEVKQSRAADARAVALAEAARRVIAEKVSTYKARNGRVVGIQDDSGEMCWIIGHEAIGELEEAIRALIPAPPAGAGWRDIATAPKDGRVVLAMFQCSMKWKPYKPESDQHRRGIKGRWQVADGDFGGWRNLAEWEPGGWRDDALPPPASDRKGE